MKKTILTLSVTLTALLPIAAQGFSLFRVDGAFTGTFLKHNTNVNSVIETIIGTEIDIKNAPVKYKLLSGCSFADNTPFNTDFTSPHTFIIEKKDGSSKAWNVIIHQLKPAELPLHISFGKQHLCNLNFVNPKPWAGYGIDYTKPTVIRFGNSGVGFTVAFSDEAKEVSFELNVVSRDNDTFNGELDVETSVDGKSWKTIKTYTATNPFLNKQLEMLPLSSNVRFVRWVYVEREKQNVNLNNITVK